MTRTYAVTITGASPLLLHWDNLYWAGQMSAWGNVPMNQKESVKGDDRSPAWRWIGCCYHDGKHIGVPSDNIMTTLREGGARVPTGKRGQTFKRQTQSGLVVDQLLWPLVVNGKPVPWEPVAALMNEPDFSIHEERAQSLGFELFLKRARVGQSKHVRVRPRFNDWSISGTVTVFDDSITQEVLGNVLDMAGMYSGLGDWRASAPKSPGPFGRFVAEMRLAR